MLKKADWLAFRSFSEGGTLALQEGRLYLTVSLLVTNCNSAWSMISIFYVKYPVCSFCSQIRTHFSVTILFHTLKSFGIKVA